MNEIKLATTDDEINRCFNVMFELRPHLQQQSFVSTVRHMQAEGYRLAFIENNAQVHAVAGFRIYTNLFMGKHLYVDDLVTSSSVRSQGYGQQLMTWLKKTAQQSNCNVLHLDSGTHRHQAHQFYFNQGLNIASFHFSEQLDKPTTFSTEE